MPSPPPQATMEVGDAVLLSSGVCSCPSPVGAGGGDQTCTVWKGHGHSRRYTAWGRSLQSGGMTTLYVFIRWQISE